ncbi:MAG: hypothetical protein A2275_16355 [Bacteroidetes bacterium RIFOXYA12_FULL_35_11]|nr:MAG: hypothetical protein A2X01_20970 [Bacteroidetes bacterium GWF2_35_48]OFY75432.1 MAG: hypothetical protein A2275_16355 [Bacteroidetes bacterium RIFOXYA12_FULL_35_11]OFZ02262.1 MAG: hypothetical protein A2491_13245 [Bacteroidetes bacterium RIFOXYC12_FULL_35_7]HBX51374.1 hypothetical protein [Bacteroidales bacterium]
MNFFEYIIAPFIFIIKQIFLFSYDITGNYGISVILLSFAISVLLLPVFFLIEKTKKRNDTVKQKMKPLLDEIKRCYKGQERYYYIKTLNRQHNYSNSKALIPILSLLLQIPFFIAAYQFLDNYEPLSGINFGFINDLKKPDGLFGIINFLPIAMTLINLITAYFYTKNGDPSEKKQMLLVAVLFLILLFNLPAALVLYWTMNNVFSFFRLFITHPEVFKKPDLKTFINKIYLQLNPLRKKLRLFLAVITLIAIGTQISWAIQFNFDTIVMRLFLAIAGSFLLTIITAFAIVSYKINKEKILKIKIRPQLFFILLFSAIYFFFASWFFFTGTNDVLLLIAILFLLPSQLIGLINFVQIKKSVKKTSFIIAACILMLTLAYQIICLVILIEGTPVAYQIFNIEFIITGNTWLHFAEAGIIATILTIPYYWKNNAIQTYLPGKHYWLIVILSLAYIFGLIFFWNPLIVYSSYPENFYFPAIAILSQNFIPFIICIGISIFIFILFPKKVKYLFLIFILSLTLLAFLYCNIIPFDIGTLQVNFFSNEQNLVQSPFYFFIENIFILTVFIIVYHIIKRNFVKPVIWGLIILNFTIIAQSLFVSINTGHFYHTKNTQNENDSINNIKGKISFSKDNKNVVLFIIDGAQGWFMNDILNEKPELQNIFSGFTYYPNTLAMSTFTYASVPSIMCGFDYSVENMNKEQDKNISSKITNASELFLKKIKQKGYYFTSTSHCYSNIDYKKIDNYLPEWHPSWSYELELGKPSEMWYTRLWENALFSCAPLSLKPLIYNNKKWLVSKQTDINSNEFHKYNFQRVLPEICDNKSDETNFIYIHSLFTHPPWDVMNDNKNFIRFASPYANFRWFVKTFIQWIEWMKKNDVYDNTKIVLVSDHGVGWSLHERIEVKVPVNWEENTAIDPRNFLHLNALLLIKDFNSKVPLKKDWRLMSSADASSIVFDENDPTKSDSTSRTIKAYITKWVQDIDNTNVYDISDEFEVKDNIFDLKNWKKIK